jgi:hypothetical protein
MFNAPSKESQSPHTQSTEKHPDASLIKLFGQLRNALVDPSTSQKAMDGIAGLAIGSFPKLGDFLSEVAQNPDMRNKLMNSTSHLTGYQGPSLHDRDVLQQRIKQLESQLGSRQGMPKSMPSPMPESMASTMPESMPRGNTNRPISPITPMPPIPSMPPMPQMQEEPQMPPVPMGMSEPTPTMPPTGRQGY